MADEKAYIVASDGELYTIPAADLPGELRAGSRVATQAEIDAVWRQQAIDKAYSTFGQRALGEVEEFADSVTLGASRWFEREVLGVPEDVLRERAERASPLSTIAGYVVPALVSGGGSAAAQGIVKGAAAGVAKGAAKELAEGVAKKATERGLASTIASVTPAGMVANLERGITRALAPEAATGLTGLAARTAATATGSAVGGALVAAGEVLSEHAIGNPVANGEDFLSHVGEGFLLGGALGGAFELGAGSLTAAARKARSATEGLVESATKAYGERAKTLFPQYAEAIDEIVENRAGLSMRGNQVVRDALEKQARGEFADPDLLPVPDIHRAAPTPDELVFRPAPRPEPVAPKIEDPDVEAFAKEMSRQIREVDEMTVAMNAATDDGLESIRRAERLALSDDIAADAASIEKINEVGRAVYNRGARLLKEMDAQPTLYPASVRSSLADALDTAAARGLGGRPTMKPVDVFEAIDDLRKGINDRDLAQYGKTVPQKQKKLVAEIRRYQRDLKETLNREDLFNQIAVRDRQIKDAYNRFASARNAPRQKGGRGYIKDFFDVRTKDGVREYVANPKKVKALLEGDSALTESFVRFQRALPDYIEQVELSAKHSPGRFERALLDEALAKVRARYEEGVAQVQRKLEAKASDKLTKRQHIEAERARRADLADQRRQFREGEQAKVAESREARKAAEAENKARVREVAQDRKAFARQGIAELEGPTPFSVWDVAGFGAGMLHPALFWPYALYRLKGFIGSPARVYRVLASLEKAVQSTSQSIASTARALSRPVRVAADAGRLAGIGYAKQVESERRRYDKRVEALRAVAASPAKLIDDLERLTTDIAEVAPESAEAAQQTAVRAVTYMLTQVPPEPQMGPFGGQYVPPGSVVADFNRSWDIAFGGVRVLGEHIRRGDLRPSDVDALRSVYPEQYADLAGRAIEAAATADVLDARATSMLSILLGQPATIARSPAALASLQASYAASDAGVGTPITHKSRRVDLSADERVTSAFDAPGPVGGRSA